MLFSVKFAVAHLFFAFFVTLSVHDAGLTYFGQKMLELALSTPELVVFTTGFVCAGLAVNAFTRSRPHRDVISQVCLAAVFVFLFQTTFSLIKNAIPQIVPFYADPYLATIDKALHFGFDAWEWVYWLLPKMPDHILSVVYFIVWCLSAIFLPIYVAMFDTDPQRVRRIMIMYIIAWFFIGNILAVMGSSVGPVFYDQLMNSERFVGLNTALHQSGPDDPLFFITQANLWWNYATDAQGFGSGISAFPSVHIAMAVVVAIYLFECSKVLLPISIGFVVSILILSVYTGYHYAVDGYFSIFVMYLVWRRLLKRYPSEQRQRKASFAAQNPTLDPAGGSASI